MAWDNFIDDLKMQINIVDVVGRDVNLKRSGSNYMGLCPFHSEKTPSFSVSEEKQFYHCFGCGETGDVIKFVQKRDGIPFMEAVEKLAHDYGIRMPERRSSGPRVDYDKYYAINAKAARFFYNSLNSRNNKGLAYLKSRGLSRETIVKFGLGYAPAGGYSLVEHMRSENVPEEDLLETGLVLKGRNGLYDRFRDRVMFPIINTQDKVIGFGGRAIGDIKPKYLNSPESQIFLKKNNLFGLNFTKKEISSEGRAVIVEGYMDVISLYQSGIKNVAASLGTALTDNQARLLCRYSKNIVLSYDSDNAGINAALRGISVINSAGGKPKVLTVTDGKDPDEFVQKNGKEAFLRLIDQAVPAVEFQLGLIRRDCDLTTDAGILEYIERIVPVLSPLGSVEQELYIRKLSEELGISEQAIASTVNTGRSGSRTAHQPYVPAGQGSSRSRSRSRDDTSIDERIEMSFALLALNNTRYLKRFRDDGISIRSPLASAVLRAVSSAADNTENGIHRIDAQTVAGMLDPDQEMSFRKYISSIQIGPDDEAFYNEVKAGYLLNNYKMEKSELLNELAIAEKTGREEDINEIADRLIRLEKQIDTINQTMEDYNA